MQSLTVLVPINQHPDVQDIINTQFNNIFNKLKEKCNLKLVWVVFQHEKIDEFKSDEKTIISFQNFENALEILDMTKPDLILIHGSLEFGNTAFVLAARFKKIPIVGTYFWHIDFLGSKLNLLAIKSRLRRLFSSKIEGDSFDKKNSNALGKLQYIFSKYLFLSTTLQKINYSPFQLLKFILWFTKIRMSQYLLIHNILNGDLNLCSIPKWINELERLGFNKSSLVLVGNPAFDDLLSKIPPENTNIKNSSKRIRILFCPAPLHEHGLIKKNKEYELIVKIISEIMRHSGFEISIKIHPSSSSKNEYEEFLKKSNISIQIYQEDDLVDLIKQHDLMVTYGGSSVTMFGVIRKKPVVFLSFFGKEKKINQFFDENVMTQCNDIRTISEKIFESKSRIISEINYKNYFEKHLGQFDGKSSERIANAILTIIKNKIFKNNK